MKNALIVSFMIISMMSLSACSSGNPLITSVPKPNGVTFESSDFGGMGKAEFPKGNDWQKMGNEYYNEKLDMTILVQSQQGFDIHRQISSFTDSYIEINKKDAPKYEVIKNEEGSVNSIKTVRIDGKFNNGTSYVTRDYLFFTENRVVILMSRIAEKNSKELNPLIDYIAGTVKK